jgi:cold shock CspA family protein
VRLTGTLQSWNDARGFGFIGPTHGGAEIFVHISALPRDGSRPTVGETLTYELGRGKNGQPQAINVLRQAVGPPSKRQPAPYRKPTRQRSFLSRVIGVALLGAIGVYAYSQYQGGISSYAGRSQGLVSQPAEPVAPQVAADGFSCDGRTHCSQMRSCSEAKYFLKNCPGTQMDGNHDGVPCEQQWCTSPFAK